MRKNTQKQKLNTLFGFVRCALFVKCCLAVYEKRFSDDDKGERAENEKKKKRSKKEQI